MTKYTLDNVEEAHKQYPATFNIPSRDVRETQVVGAYVKLFFRMPVVLDGFEAERM